MLVITKILILIIFLIFNILLKDDADIDLRNSVDCFTPSTVTIESEHNFSLGTDVYVHRMYNYN